MNPLADGARTSSKSVSHEEGKEFINLISLPEDVRSHLRAFDTDGDGKIETAELAALARRHQNTEENSTLFKKVTVLLGTLMVIMVLISFGLSFAVYALTRDMVVENDILNTIEHHPVQTANNEMNVSDNVLANRQNGAPLATAPAAYRYNGNGASPEHENKFFQELDTVDFEADGAYANFKITGFTRTPAHLNADGDKDLITLLTDNGKIYLTGVGEYHFSDEVMQILTDSGFQMDSKESNGRKLHFITVSAMLAVAIVGMVGAGTYGIIGCGVQNAADVNVPGSCTIAQNILQGLTGK